MDEKRRKRISPANGPRQKRAPRKIDARYLENAALYYLQRYASSSQNLKTVLSRKIMRSCTHHGQDPQDFLPLLDPLIARYQQSGLLDDTVYAQGRVASLRRQGLSRQAITQKLAQKGLSAAEVTAALRQVDATAADIAGDDIDDAAARELAAARTLAKRKRLGRWRRNPPAERKDANKEMAALARAGFSYDIARRALEAPADDDSHIDFE